MGLLQDRHEYRLRLWVGVRLWRCRWLHRWERELPGEHVGAEASCSSTGHGHSSARPPSMGPSITTSRFPAIATATSTAQSSCSPTSATQQEVASSTATRQVRVLLHWARSSAG